MDTAAQEFAAFLNEWTTDPCGAKDVLLRFRDLLAGIEGVSLSYRCRPGVSYSIRATGKAQSKRELFVLVDVVDDDPASRWLSVCFYADLITDPEEKGDWVPEGLFGEDANCFNYDESDPAMEAYIAERLRESAAAACTDGAR
ncbi:MAG TPA: hypothetical protein H9894_02290 [Candidatus Desulfovibrio intestinipullorum]|uniref:Uncharacterized protein n=1 Tax=Candidatus Desulfovibrio intestinipullorum TaxID=2838536 RepID=A0A9D1TP49_9BACT|nr:hypothetical protein [Candidatus Desulfovibrio intestinipullorum]